MLGECLDIFAGPARFHQDVKSLCRILIIGTAGKMTGKALEMIGRPVAHHPMGAVRGLAGKCLPNAIEAVAVLPEPVGVGQDPRLDGTTLGRIRLGKSFGHHVLGSLRVGASAMDTDGRCL